MVSVPNKNIIPSGLISKSPSTDPMVTAELRTTLQKTAEKRLSVSERWALNETFFKGEEVFSLFPKGHHKGDVDIFISRQKGEIPEFNPPKGFVLSYSTYFGARCNTLNSNLKNALKKLEKALKSTFK